MVMPLDHGRCSSMAGLSHDDFGDMFSIQASGDHVLSDFESHRWKCYNPQRDIVIPIRTEARFTVNDTIRPLDTERNISILYRFVGGGRGDYGILRSRLLAKQLGDPIPGGVSGWQTVNGTHDDMTHSIFCVCPPGIAQHTLRVWRSIMFGCIPITFFNANDNPYTFSRLDYSKFSINIDPTEWYLLQPIIKGLLARPERIALMQEELAKIQTRFVWDSENFSGAFQAVFEELALHPSRFVSLSLSEWKLRTFRPFTMWQNWFNENFLCDLECTCRIYKILEFCFYRLAIMADASRIKIGLGLQGGYFSIPFLAGQRLHLLPAQKWQKISWTWNS